MTYPAPVSIALDALAEYRDQHQDRYDDPSTPDDVRLHDAIDALEAQALKTLATGRVDPRLEDALAAYSPGTSPQEKVAQLFRYNIVHERLEWTVAVDVLRRLKPLPSRIQHAVLGFSILMRSDPSDTAIKYFERAVQLYLAGYDGEVTVMCGAVLEAALAARIDDETLRAAGIRPRHAKTGVYSVGQRMRFESSRPIFTPEQRDQFWEIINWRNDAVHVQIDMGPRPEYPLVLTAAVLGAILPRVA